MWHEARKQEKKVRGMIVDYKRRAERRREFYEKIRRDPAQFLQIHGSSAKIHMDSSISTAAEGCLMPWRGDEKNMIDRFDVRAHLDTIDSEDIPSTSRHDKSESEKDLASERQINYERWRTLIQDEFLSIPESKALHQIWLEERYGMNQPSMTDSPTQQNVNMKKKLADKKAKIGFNYDKLEDKNLPVKSVNESSSSEEDSDSDEEFDTTINIETLTGEQTCRLNSIGTKFGLGSDDFVIFAEEDLAEAERIRIAKELENEKSMFSGRKSRRERRALKERRMLILRANNPEENIKPMASLKSSNSNEIKSGSTSESSESEVDEAKIEFITSFGGSSDEGQNEEELTKKDGKGKPNKKKDHKNSKVNVAKKNAPIEFGPSLPPEIEQKMKNNIPKISPSRDITPPPRRSPSVRRSLSRSPDFVSRKCDFRARNFNSNRSRSRSPTSKRYMGRIRERSRNRRRTRSKSRSRSRSRGRNRSCAKIRSYRNTSRERRSYRKKSWSKSRSRSCSRSRSRSRSFSRSRHGFQSHRRYRRGRGSRSLSRSFSRSPRRRVNREKGDRNRGRSRSRSKSRGRRFKSRHKSRSSSRRRRQKKSPSRNRSLVSKGSSRREKDEKKPSQPSSLNSDKTKLLTENLLSVERKSPNLPISISKSSETISIKPEQILPLDIPMPSVTLDPIKIIDKIETDEITTNQDDGLNLPAMDISPINEQLDDQDAKDANASIQCERNDEKSEASSSLGGQNLPLKSYYRHDLVDESSGPELDEEVEEEPSSTEKLSPKVANSVNTCVSKAGNSIKALTDKMKKKTQALIERQYKLDKAAEREKRENRGSDRRERDSRHCRSRRRSRSRSYSRSSSRSRKYRSRRRSSSRSSSSSHRGFTRSFSRSKSRSRSRSSSSSSSSSY
ncbi:CLK4-associating serine/arginine rich protein-like isoform X2 [Panonychus citri]|uniref:CLK4-associating serine/arginine rich protein-like isoform X2 n=1 Tax=Panonychus citri TaxID=50023 RepID=UPI002306FE62|nr:CLK4-associating serine/arginine rich protein-like isoform X2 [Panonychus citri]